MDNLVDLMEKLRRQILSDERLALSDEVSEAYNNLVIAVRAAVESEREVIL